MPSDMPEFTWADIAKGESECRLTDLMGNSGLFPSKKEARRMIQQGAVKIDSEKVEDPSLSLTTPSAEVIIQAGKRKFFKIIA